MDDNLPGSSKYPAFQFAKDDAASENANKPDPVPLPNSTLHADPSNQMSPAQPTPPIPETTQGFDTGLQSPTSDTQFKTQMEAHVIPNTTGPSKKPGSKARFAAITLTVFLFLIASGTGAFAWGVAQNRIKLDKYPKVELAIKQVVFSIPGVPKSAEFLIAKSYLAQDKVDKQSYDISFAVSPDAQSDILGLGNLDFQIKGNIDYSDPKNVNFTSNIFLSKGLNVEVRKLNSMVYFNVKGVPAIMLTALGLNKDQFTPVLNKWIAWDTTPLDTEARKMLEDQEVDTETSINNDELSNLLDPTILDKIMVTSSDVDGHKAYKLTLDADPQTVDTIQTIMENYSENPGNLSVLGYTADAPKLSDFVKLLKIEAYIDKDTYYMRKLAATVSFEYDPAEFDALNLGENPTTPSQKSKVTVVYASLFDNFGENVIIEIPQTDMTSDEFLATLSGVVSTFYSGLLDGQANFMPGNITPDTKRLDDLDGLAYLLEIYNLDCGKYPSNLNELTQPSCSNSDMPYVNSLPKDPTGTDYYYSSDGVQYDLCANLDVMLETKTPCPDSGYNYHLDSESF